MELANKRSSFNALVIFNALAFQLVWFVCVQGNNNVALIAALALMVCHLALFRPAKTELLTMAQLIGLGILFDSLLMSSGLVQYHASHGFIIPGWLIALWIAFATTVHHSMTWIFSKPWLPALTGLCLVPFSYWAGIRFSGSEFTVHPIIFLLTDGIVWALLLSVLWWRFQQQAESHE